MEWSVDAEKICQNDRAQFPKPNEASHTNNAIVDFAQSIDFEDAIPKFEVKTEPEKYPSFEDATKGYNFPKKTENQDDTSNIQPSFYQSMPQPPAYYSRGE